MIGHMMIFKSTAPAHRSERRVRTLPDDFVCLTPDQRRAARRYPVAS
jgi:hypothetical protein